MPGETVPPKNSWEAAHTVNSYYLKFVRILTSNAMTSISVDSPTRSMQEKIQVLS